MSDSRTSAGADDETGAESPVERQPGLPRWVKVSAIAAAVLVILVVLMLLVAGGHGPGRH